MKATVVLIKDSYLISFKEAVYQYHNITFNEFAKHIQFILPINCVLAICGSDENIEIYKCYLETIGYSLL
jgi:hypothetical protein